MLKPTVAAAEFENTVLSDVKANSTKNAIIFA